MRRVLLAIVLTLALASPGVARAAGGTWAVDGGTAAEQAQVGAALDASSFDWGLLPAIHVHIAPGASYATPGQVYLDPGLLDAGQFAWGTVQHEFAHEVDFFLLDDAKRAQLASALGVSQWCYGEQMTLAHDAYGCERFASELAWAYWPSPENAMKPGNGFAESAGMAPAAFRTLVGQLVGTPNVPSTAAAEKAYAPKVKQAKVKRKLK
jgi:hypothetical protein